MSNVFHSMLYMISAVWSDIFPEYRYYMLCLGCQCIQACMCGCLLSWLTSTELTLFMMYTALWTLTWFMYVRAVTHKQVSSIMPSYSAYRVISDCFLRAVPQTLLQLIIFSRASTLVSQNSVTLSIATSLFAVIKNAVAIKLAAASFKLKVGVKVPRLHVTPCHTSVHP